MFWSSFFWLHPKWKFSGLPGSSPVFQVHPRGTEEHSVPSRRRRPLVAAGSSCSVGPWVVSHSPEPQGLSAWRVRNEIWAKGAAVPGHPCKVTRTVVQEGLPVLRTELRIWERNEGREQSRKKLLWTLSLGTHVYRGEGIISLMCMVPRSSQWQDTLHPLSGCRWPLREGAVLSFCLLNVSSLGSSSQ